MPNVNLETDLLLNMQMLKDDLEEKYNILYTLFLSDTQKLRGAQVYYGQTDLSPNLVYVAPAEVFAQHPIACAEICQISVGPLKNHEVPACCARMEVASARWEDVFNTVLSIFVRYASWTQQLRHILSSGGGLYELCVAAIDLFQNPLFVHDENYNILAMPMRVVGMTKVLVDETTGNTTIPLERIQAYQTNPEYIRTLSTRGAQMWDPAHIYSSHRTIYVNIWVQDKYCGRFLINEMTYPLKPSHFTIAEYFARILSLAFQQNLFKSQKDTTFEKILYRLLCGEKIEEAYLIERLHMVGWEQHHRYICFQLRLQERNFQLLSAKMLSSTVGIFLKKSFSFPVGNVVYTICNLTQSGYSCGDCEKIMLHIGKAAPLVIGASSSFQDFTEVEEYFRQAGTAIEVGHRLHPEHLYFPFDRYVLDYVIRHCLSDYSVQAICSNAILQLAALDQEKNTDYIKTLQCYFDNNCQQTATANAMFIHRTTLTYRLEKILELTGVDLSDPDTRLYLQISIKLLNDF